MEPSTSFPVHLIEITKAGNGNDGLDHVSKDIFMKNQFHHEGKLTSKQKFGYFFAQ